VAGVQTSHTHPRAGWCSCQGWRSVTATGVQCTPRSYGICSKQARQFIAPCSMPPPKRKALGQARTHPR
jgi:hypothetical protein